MKIKKFTADSIPEAIRLVKKDMGNDAVILNTRELSRILSRSGARAVEITAAVDLPEQEAKSDSQSKKTGAGGNRMSKVVPSLATNGSKPSNVGGITSINKQYGPLQAAHISELNRVKELFGERYSGPSSKGCLELIPEEVANLYRQLPWMNIHPEVIDEIARATISGLLPGPANDSLKNRWCRYLLAKCPSAEPLSKLLRGGPMAFTGLAGSGRSSLIAKIAHRCIKAEKLRVTIISLDNYNVSGEHQLRRFAKILGARFFATTRLEELEQKISKFKPEEPILMDLPPLDSAIAAENDLLSKIASMALNRVMVIDSLRHFSLVEEVINKAKQFDLTHLAFSHYEESPNLGLILDVLLRFGPRPIIAGTGRSLAGTLIDLDVEKILAAFFARFEQGKAND